MITKSDYMLFCKCPKLFWNRSKITLNETELYRMKQGNLVGDLARKLFPNGTFNEYKKGIPSFEKSFTFNEFLIKPDILTNDLIEVKSSSKVKDEHLKDIGFQKYVLENSGINVENYYVMHINSSFVKGEPLKNFFTKEKVEPIEPDLSILDLKEEPRAIYSTECTDCPIKKTCLPENTITHLFLDKKRAYELLNKGITSITEVEPKNEKQEIQKQNKIHVNKEKIKSFLDEFISPVHYLDFETFSPVFPIYENTNPYQAIPFQYSLHIEEEHISFIADHTKDPRLEFLESLQKNILPTGSIVVYNQTFEKSILKRLAKDFPVYKSFVDSILPRIIDLAVPFKNFYYYNPLQKGKYSIKYVLPALTEISYKDLEIQNGEDASYKYYSLVTGEETNVNKILQDLDKYCELDTLAELKIIKKLKKLIE
ncbi:DUF2779 domain-containing protein [Candidatus Woesearchaeota archaeon]|nr:DUF2779 domain-containing protein [Candidatus Woesearchaeota archaeon]